jgi:hypothetical protein
LAPFGAGNPAVKLGSTGLKVVDEAAFGKSTEHRRLLVADEQGHRQEIIWWRGAAERPPQDRFDLAFTLSSDDYRGGDAVQVEWLAAREWEPAAVQITREFIDWRQRPDVEAAVQKLDSRMVWAEGTSLSTISVARRDQLAPAESLVIWTAPPGQDILQQAVDAVSPRRVVLVARPAPFDTFPALIKQLLGLVKFAIVRNEGELMLYGLAATLGHRPTTARLGIDWLAAQGRLSIYADKGDVLVLRPAHKSPDPQSAAALEETLQAALAETAAYRQFFRQASLAAIKRMVE